MDWSLLAFCLGVVIGYVLVFFFCFVGAFIGATYLIIGRVSAATVDYVRWTAAVSVGMLGTLASFLPVAWLVQSGFALPVLIAFVALLLLGDHFFGHRLESSLMQLKGRRGENIVRRYLARRRFEAVHDVYVEAVGRIAQIDHLVHIDGLLVVVETKNYTQAVFGTALAAEWQVGRRKYAYPDFNPLTQNKRHVDVVRAKLGGRCAVHGVVVVPNHTEFPKGRPDGVLPVRELGKFLEALATVKGGPPRPDVWHELLELLRQDEKAGARTRHRAGRIVEPIERAGMSVAGDFGRPPHCSNCQRLGFSLDKGYSCHWKCDHCGDRRRIILPPGGRLDERPDGVYVLDTDGSSVRLGSLPIPSRPLISSRRLPRPLDFQRLTSVR